MPSFKGVFPAVITPMTADDRLNEVAFREVLEFNIQAGAHGFWLAGGTGESVLLDDEENMRIAEIAADQARGRVLNIHHVGAPTTARSAGMAEHAAKAGVDAICCVPPFFYSQSDDDIAEHYKIIAAAADLPFFVYNSPRFTGVEVTPDLMLKIQDRVPQLVGLKHSALSFANVRAFADMGLSCLLGNADLMLPGLTIGGAGAIDGVLNMAPELYVEIWNAYGDGDMARAEAAQKKASEANALVLNFGLHPTIKAVLSERLGVDCGEPRRPGLPLSAERRAVVLAAAAKLGLTRVAVKTSGATP